MEETSKKTSKSVQDVNNSVTLTRPVSAAIFAGTWFDVFPRPGRDGAPDTFVVWSPLAPVGSATVCHKVGIFGAYLDEYRARAVANTMLCFTRKELSLVPVHADLMATFLDEGMDAVPSTLVALADFLPESFYEESEEVRRPMPDLTGDELELLTQQIESMEGTASNWMLMQVGPGSPGQDIADPGVSLFARFYQGEVVAAIPFSPDIFTKNECAGYVAGRVKKFICVDPIKIDGVTAMMHPRFAERLQELTERVDASLLDDDRKIQQDDTAVGLVGRQISEVKSMMLSAFFGHKVNQLGNNIFGTTVKKKINETILQ